MSLRVAFISDTNQTVENVESLDMLAKLGGLVIRDPKINDGMGQKVVHSSGKLRVFAEYISMSWIDRGGDKKEAHFHGRDSYLLQSIIEKLESSHSE